MFSCFFLIDKLYKGLSKFLSYQKRLKIYFASYFIIQDDSGFRLLKWKTLL